MTRTFVSLKNFYLSFSEKCNFKSFFLPFFKEINFEIILIRIVEFAALLSESLIIRIVESAALLSGSLKFLLLHRSVLQHVETVPKTEFSSQNGTQPLLTSINTEDESFRALVKH
ncbi:hypothetical protein BpHYR1_020140 [Brachionus plicatilis]|uniref:Uncharacterized protein n=1 Tax=Brachionus plicatilis TaxID=10195 RepID=A0A3M7RE64_BRAPC|nr:hypothetical protein BpHYR1_020140 [Brachionus plicatilis]